MPKRNIEQELRELSELRTQSVPGEPARALEKALNDKVNVIVARAATVAGELNLCSLIPHMLVTFERLFVNPVKTDQQCWGKNALAKALKDLGHSQAAIFLKGARHVQLEPVWCNEVDTATTLRGSCAMALVQCTDIPLKEIMTCLVDALADKAAPVRQDAVHALEGVGSPASILLLRLKARVGDEDPAITGDILTTLLRLEDSAALEFVESFFDHPQDEIREEAALALGTSRLEGAITALRDRWAKPRSPVMTQTLIRAAAASRLESALPFLLEIIRSGGRTEALAALQSIAAQRHSARIWEDIANSVSQSGDDEVQALFSGEFPKPNTSES